ncbi:DUF6968 family protein [Polyangium spumosum]|uniref:DUF6968 domain-containing protein n=1 Tax=Polyangium spumosum TaxID=889282 RepID=A0A6N7PUJ7_9BACT|nr:hypothetical protein [Polyangium spumosum]MRG94090.1 hypothetical protein [Polyangium spumosum]
MATLTTRVLQYRGDDGKERDVTLTVFVPFADEHGGWKCGFQFSPPTHRRVVYVGGIDFIQALVGCLKVARGYVEHPEEERSHWQGMSHSGLPTPQARPGEYRAPEVPAPESNPGDLEVLTTRALGHSDTSGVETELVFTVFKPFQADDGSWKCGFAFGPSEGASVRYGVGADFIEAFLDALALARVAFDDMAPTGPASGLALDCSDFPYKVGRAFATDPVVDPDAVAPP